MKPTPALAALTLAALMAAAPALASTGRGALVPMMQELDFAAIDADGNGAITLEEWRAHVTGRVETRRAERIDGRVAALMEGDADGDGLLSRDELAARIAAMADEARASRAEWRSERGAERGAERRAERGAERGAERAPMRRAERGGMDRPSGYGMRHAGRSAGAGADPETMVVRSFQRLDRNGDAAISREEFDTALARMQERLDRRAERMERRGEGRARN